MEPSVITWGRDDEHLEPGSEAVTKERGNVSRMLKQLRGSEHQPGHPGGETAEMGDPVSLVRENE